MLTNVVVFDVTREAVTLTEKISWCAASFPYLKKKSFRISGSVMPEVVVKLWILW